MLLCSGECSCGLTFIKLKNFYFYFAALSFVALEGSLLWVVQILGL